MSCGVTEPCRATSKVRTVRLHSNHSTSFICVLCIWDGGSACKWLCDRPVLEEGVVETVALPKELNSLTISSLIMWHDLAPSRTTQSRIIWTRQKTLGPASDATYHLAYRNWKGPTYRRKRCPNVVALTAYYTHDEGDLRGIVASRFSWLAKVGMYELIHFRNILATEMLALRDPRSRVLGTKKGW